MRENAAYGKAGHIPMQELQAAPDYRIPIRPLLTRPDEKRSVSVQIDTETARSFGLTCQAPPTVEAVLENRAGVLMLDLHVRCTLLTACDRCLSEVALDMDESFFHIIVTETADAQNDAEYLLAPDAMLDLAEAALTDLRLELPSRVLCAPDCRGLCPVCGKNRNEGDCGCEGGAVTFTVEDEP